MSYGSFSALLTGDSEETERAWWLRNDPSLVRNCTILKVAHHGSRNGTDARNLYYAACYRAVTAAAIRASDKTRAGAKQADTEADRAMQWLHRAVARGHRNVLPLEGAPQLAALVKGIARPGDYVVCLGAGNITQWAYALPGELKALGER